MQPEQATIINFFNKVDEQRKSEGKQAYHDTQHGIWGASNLYVCDSVFRQIELEKAKGFCDLGSGDGRVVLLASLSTHALGIEADAQLVSAALQYKHELARVVSTVNNCAFLCKRYDEIDLSAYDVLFVFADHSWNEDFETRLLSSWKGIILSYDNIFAPKRLKKGKTYWGGQSPIVSYLVNIVQWPSDV